jgi:hypothetical protein
VEKVVFFVTKKRKTFPFYELGNSMKCSAFSLASVAAQIHRFQNIQKFTYSMCAL